MLNSVVLAGNLGANPEVFYSQTETIATFNLAFKGSKKKVGWIRSHALAKQRDRRTAHKKRYRIGVSGSLDYHQWENDEGSKRSAIQMIANTIEFIKVKDFRRVKITKTVSHSEKGGLWQRSGSSYWLG